MCDVLPLPSPVAICWCLAVHGAVKDAVEVRQEGPQEFNNARHMVEFADVSLQCLAIHQVDFAVIIGGSFDFRKDVGFGTGYEVGIMLALVLQLQLIQLQSTPRRCPLLPSCRPA